MSNPINQAPRLAGLVTLCVLFLRATPEEEELVSLIPVLPVLDDETTDFSRIRCPLCRWQPDAGCYWVCGDCDDPE